MSSKWIRHSDKTVDEADKNWDKVNSILVIEVLAEIFAHGGSFITQIEQLNQNDDETTASDTLSIPTCVEIICKLIII